MLEKIGKLMFGLGILFSLFAFAWEAITSERSMAASILQVAGSILILVGIIIYIISIVIRSRKTKTATDQEEKNE